MYCLKQRQQDEYLSTVRILHGLKAPSQIPLDSPTSLRSEPPVLATLPTPHFPVFKWLWQLCYIGQLCATVKKLGSPWVVEVMVHASPDPGVLAGTPRQVTKALGLEIWEPLTSPTTWDFPGAIHLPAFSEDQRRRQTERSHLFYVHLLC